MTITSSLDFQGIHDGPRLAPERAVTIDPESQPANPPPSPFIDGISDYCDRWCERCRFQRRCRLFRDRRIYEAAFQGSAGAEEIVRLVEAANAAEPRPELTAAQQAEWDAFVKDANRRMTPEEIAAFDERQARVKAAMSAEPLVIAARDYASLTHPILDALHIVLEGRTDPVLSAALETIWRFQFTIAVKAHRALHSWHEAHRDDGDGDDRGDDRREDRRDDRRKDGCDRYRDANCTAKLLHLIVAESCDAWRVFGDAGLANGVPAAMAERLQALDGLILERFPNAETMVRPGWDEEQWNA